MSRLISELSDALLSNRTRLALDQTLKDWAYERAGARGMLRRWAVDATSAASIARVLTVSAIIEGWNPAMLRILGRASLVLGALVLVRVVFMAEDAHSGRGFFLPDVVYRTGDGEDAHLSLPPNVWLAFVGYSLLGSRASIVPLAIFVGICSLVRGRGPSTVDSASANSRGGTTGFHDRQAPSLLAIAIGSLAVMLIFTSWLSPMAIRHYGDVVDATFGVGRIPRGAFAEQSSLQLLNSLREMVPMLPMRLVHELSLRLSLTLLAPALILFVSAIRRFDPTAFWHRVAFFILTYPLILNVAFSSGSALPTSALRMIVPLAVPAAVIVAALVIMRIRPSRRSPSRV